MKRRMWLRYGMSISLLCASLGMLGCQATPATERLVTWEGPQLNHGRMSASLGAVRLKNGRIAVIGGSPSEYPFVPLRGTKSIELVDPECVLSPKCKSEKEKCKCWFSAGIDLKYPISGAAFTLPDGRILAFSSVFIFNQKSNRTDPDPPSKNEPTSGPVSAVLIDLANKSVTPIYRPKDNIGGNPPITGTGPALMMRAFERNIQLRDGRIVRIGGHVNYVEAPPVGSCKESVCSYCSGKKCEVSSPPIKCDKDSDCPAKKAQKDFHVLNDIEIYTPPSAQFPMGRVQHLKMKEARSSVSAIELVDGRVLITGGWGPKGIGKNQNYLHTYYLDLKKEKPELIDGPEMLFYREDHSMAVMKDGRVLITGGTNHEAITIRQSEFFDPKQGLFFHAPSMNLSREDHVGVPLGPWLLFFGGEVNEKADQIRNTMEMFNASTGAYIGPYFLFSRTVEGAYKGFAGTTDFAVLHLDANTLFLFGGQQGLQDRDGEYISGGLGSKRSLVLQYRTK